MFDLLTPEFSVELDIEVKQSFDLQVAENQGGFHQSEMLLLDQQRHDEEVQQLHKQVNSSY